MKKIHRKQNSGFTLFQLVALIVVLGLIATTAVQLVVILTPSTWENEARRELEIIKCAVIGCTEGDCGFIGDAGAIPTLLEHLLTDPGIYCNWQGPYLDVGFVDDPLDYLVDPWGNPYIWDSENLTITSTAGGNTDPIIISMASSTAELLGNSVQYQFTDENGAFLTPLEIEVYVNYGCGDILLDYDESIGFYGDGFPECGLEVSVINLVAEDTLYPPDCPNPPCDPAPITCQWGSIEYDGSVALSGAMNDIVSLDIKVTGECTFTITSVSIQWKGSSWCGTVPYLESFILNGTSYWNYITDNNGVRATSGQELILSSDIELAPGSGIEITDLKFANQRFGDASPMMMEGSEFIIRMFSGLAPTQRVAFTTPGTPPSMASVRLIDGTTQTFDNNCNVQFDIGNYGECCIEIVEMVIEWDTTCVIPYMTEVTVDNTTYWYDNQCRAASGQYIVLEESVVICDDVVTVGLQGFNDNRGSLWGSNYFYDHCDNTISGSLNINPNNSADNEFYLIKTDGSVLTRDSLHSELPDYSGAAAWVHVRPKGNGNQNTMTVNGSTYSLQNNKFYDFGSVDMTVNLYNDNRDGFGYAMGQWYIGITATDACFDESTAGYWFGGHGGSGHGGYDHGGGAGSGFEFQNHFSCESGGGQSNSGHGGDHNDDHNGDHNGDQSSGGGYSPYDCPDDDGDGKVTICHHPSGDSDITQTICIPVNYWDRHKAHGDECGECSDGDVFDCSNEPDRVSGSGDCLDMRGQNFTVTLITVEGEEVPLTFNTGSLGSPVVQLYGTNITTTGGGSSTAKFYVENGGASAVQLDRMAVTWDKADAFMSKLKLGGHEYWNYADGSGGRLASGGIIDLDARYLLEAGRYIKVELKDFKNAATGSGSNSNMEGVDFDVRFLGVTPDCEYDVEFVTPGGSDHSGDHDGDDHGGDDHGGDDHSGGDEDCCDGQVSQLTLQYDGGSSATIKVIQSQDMVTIYEGSVSAGASFSFVGTRNGNAMGSRIRVYINDTFNTEIHTSCSQPIGPGLVSGSFTVVSGESRNGGALCEIE